MIPAIWAVCAEKMKIAQSSTAMPPALPAARLVLTISAACADAMAAKVQSANASGMLRHP